MVLGSIPTTSKFFSRAPAVLYLYTCVVWLQKDLALRNVLSPDGFLSLLPGSFRAEAAGSVASRESSAGERNSPECW